MVASVLSLLSRVLFRVEVRGKANVPKHGKLLVIANHESSFMDGLMFKELPLLGTGKIDYITLKNMAEVA